MRFRRYFVGLAAVLMAVTSTIIIAGPAGAVSNTCNSTMNPAANGGASGLIVACTFTNKANAGASLTINDYNDAVWHYGASRNVSVTFNPTVLNATITTTATCATQLAIGAGPAGDVNHSVEFATSNPATPPTGCIPSACVGWAGQYIAPGTFVKSVVGTTVTLSQNRIAGPSCANPCTKTVMVSNGIGRETNDGKTAAASNCLTSPKMNFKPADIGMFVSAGDLPDGATIKALPGTCAAGQAELQCVGCAGGPGIVAFSSVTATSGSCVPGGTPPCLVTTLSPANPDSSARFVTDGVYSIVSGVKTITSATANFNAQDVGLNVVGNPSTQVPTGARIATTAVVSGSVTKATLTNGTTPGTFTAGSARRFTIGKPTKTAPKNLDVVGALSIEAILDPTLSPTSPPCAAGKISGFDIPLTWENPGSYNLVSAGTSDFQGNKVSPTSIGQFIFLTSATRFGGFLVQNGTVSGTALTTTTYDVKFEFLPVAVGLCSTSGIAEALRFTGIAPNGALVPSHTGGGGGGVRGLRAVPEGTSQTYGLNGTPGAANQTGAFVQTAGPTALPGTTPTNNNECTVVAPNVLQSFCGPVSRSGDVEYPG